MAGDVNESRPCGYVSTGSLPPAGVVQLLISEAYQRYKPYSDGVKCTVYPGLARVPSDLFGICAVDTRGNVASAGDSDVEFTLMSVSKPFVFALVCNALGAEEVRRHIGVNATGHPFNSLAGIELSQSADGRTNPMVNSGAISTTSLVPGSDIDAKWKFLRDGLCRFAGRELSFNDEIYQCALATNSRNQSIARMLQSCGRLYDDPARAIDLYTRQCCLNVTARDLAVMAATLAGGGMNPLTRDQVVPPLVCHYVLAVMATAGMYEASGDWLYNVGLPGKSSISGGIIAVSPGKAGIATFSPLLDATGNSIKGQLAAQFLSHQLGMDIFISQSAKLSGNFIPT